MLKGKRKEKSREPSSLLRKEARAKNRDKKLELRNKPDSVYDDHSSRMDVTSHLKRLPGGRDGQSLRVPHLPCSRWGLPSSISHLMDWCAFTAPFHLYNALGRCSLLSVALSIASPLLGGYPASCPAESGLSSSVSDATIYSTQVLLLYRICHLKGKENVDNPKLYGRILNRAYKETELVVSDTEKVL